MWSRKEKKPDLTDLVSEGYLLKQGYAIYLPNTDFMTKGETYYVRYLQVKQKGIEVWYFKGIN